MLLGERPGEEIALGLVGKFWRPVIEYAEVSAGDFRDFAEPGYAKTVYALAARSLEEGHAALRVDAYRDHRRARPSLVSPVLDVRRRLGRSHARARPAGVGARASRATIASAMNGAPRRRRTVGRWLAGWVGGAVLGIANGLAREATLSKRFHERTAHQLSTLTAIAAFAGYFALLQRRWPLTSTREALSVGGAWLALTIAFEFLFGRLVAKQSWSDLVADYNLARGRTWPLVLAWIAIGPAATARVAPSKAPHSRP